MTFNWNKAEEQFVEDRIITMPIEMMKELVEELPYEISEKQMMLLSLMTDDQIRTSLFSIQRVMVRFAYVERVAELKFSNEEQAKNHCMDLLYSEPSWRESFAIYGEDQGQSGVVGESFPHSGDQFETYWFDTGQIVSYRLSKSGLLNGVVLDRKVVWEALQAIWWRNLALLRFKLDRAVIKSKIKEI